MTKKRIFTLVVFLAFVFTALFASVPPAGASAPAGDTQSVTLLEEDFENGMPVWSGTGANPTMQTAGGNNYARVAPGGGSFMQLMFDPVALTSAGGPSLGKNVRLTAEYKMAKVAHGNGNSAFGGVTSGDALYNADAFAASTRMNDAPPVEMQLFYYAGYLGGSDHQYRPPLYQGPVNSAASAGNNIWVQFKFVVTITDENGDYITPVVDIYVTDFDAGWIYPATPSYSGGLINVYDTVDAFRVSASGGSPAMGVDDINITLSYESDEGGGDPGLGYPIPAEADENSRYITVDGGTIPRDGKSWETAYAASQLQAAWDATPSNGTLYAASGNYGRQTINVAASGGGAGLTAMKRLIGFDIGFGKPVFTDTVAAGNKTGTSTFFYLRPGANYVWIENIDFNNYAYIIRTDGSNTGIRVYDIYSYNAQDSLYIMGAQGGINDMIVENCYFQVYGKSGIRMSNDIHNVLIKDCIADAGGEPEYFRDNWPVGFQISGANPGTYEDNITFVNCVSMNSFENDGYGTQGGYWNGDGYTAEWRSKDLTYIRCGAFGSTDGGWDLKTPTVMLLDCVSMDNKSNFKFWAQQEVILINCLSAYAYRRGGTGEANGVESCGATMKLYNCTIMESNEYEIRYATGAGSTGSVTLNDCIIIRSPTKRGGANLGYVDQMDRGPTTFNDCAIYTNGYPRMEHSNIFYNNTEVFTDAAVNPGIQGYAGPKFPKAYLTYSDINSDDNFNSFFDGFSIFNSSVYNGTKGYQNGIVSAIPINADYPVITNITGSQAVDKYSDFEMSVEATKTDGGILTYQWYSNRVNANFSGVLIPGATNSTYAPPTDRLGSIYYYVEATNTISSKGFNRATTASEPVRITVIGEPDPEPPGPPTEKIPVLVEDFEDGMPEWVGPGTKPTLVTNGGNSYARVQPASNYVDIPFYEAVALRAAGGESLGKNVKLIAEYKLAKIAGSNGNYIFGSVTDSSAATGNAAFGASSRIGGAALFRYANIIDSTDSGPILYLGPSGGNNQGVGEGLWVQFKFVVSITDENGNFITPTVDIYVTDEDEYWYYPADPIIAKTNLLYNANIVDAIRIGTGGGSTIMGIDDINVYIQIELDEPEPEPYVVGVLPSAEVAVITGATNDLYITVEEEMSDGTINIYTLTVSIKNNASGVYNVGPYEVFVDTKGNDQIRECVILE